MVMKNNPSPSALARRTLGEPSSGEATFVCETGGEGMAVAGRAEAVHGASPIGNVSPVHAAVVCSMGRGASERAVDEGLRDGGASEGAGVLNGCRDIDLGSGAAVESAVPAVVTTGTVALAVAVVNLGES
ncbi:hypothetical protein VNO80_27245 [Phaseolus coccineus]|uniref:Uncharacterized protein n=1 Tax=Phaseolus coccineus TaxID=3886 RepID=A0AAN9QHC7_PHACN